MLNNLKNTNMKKIYFLFIILISTASFGQELLLNGGFESWDDATSPTSWTKAENTDQESTEFHTGTYAAKHTGDGTKDISQTVTGIIPGKSYTVTIWYKVDAGFGDGTDARIWSLWKNGSTTVYHTPNTTDDPLRSYDGYLDNNGNVWTEHKITVTAPADVDGFYFEVRAYTGAVVYWDDFSFFEEATVSPSLNITTPSEGDVLTSGDVDVELSVLNFSVTNDGSGDGHIHYNIDGGSDVMKFDTTPINITGLSPGEHTVDVRLVDNSHTDLTPSISASVTFNVVVVQSLPVSEDFAYSDGSLTDNPSWFGFSGASGDLIISSGQALVQHGTSSEDASLLFTPVSGNIYYALDFTVVDLGGPISGTDNEYFAMFKDGGFGYSARLDIVPPATTGDFSVGIASDESTADAVWATDLSYGVKYRVTVKFDQDTNLAELWIDAVLETDTSILGEDRADPGDSVQAFALRQSESDLNEGILVDNLRIATTFSATTLSIGRTEIEGFAIYPNPVSNGEFFIRSRNGVSKSVQIFDMLGKQVYSKEVQANENVKISNLNMGIYILKVQEEGRLATRKLVVQ
jgi:hypothetical protein